MDVVNLVFFYEASTAPGVVQCDMSNVPLPNESVDLVVFCLALMGTNIKVITTL